jgi:hypothetical protein
LASYECLSSSKEAKKAAEQYIKEVWQGDETLRQYMAEKLHPTYFMRVAELCEDAGGQNNFTA